MVREHARMAQHASAIRTRAHAAYNPLTRKQQTQDSSRTRGDSKAVRSIAAERCVAARHSNTTHPRRFRCQRRCVGHSTRRQPILGLGAGGGVAAGCATHPWLGHRLDLPRFRLWQCQAQGILQAFGALMLVRRMHRTKHAPKRRTRHSKKAPNEFGAKPKTETHPRKPKHIRANRNTSAKNRNTSEQTETCSCDV